MTIASRTTSAIRTTSFVLCLLVPLSAAQAGSYVSGAEEGVAIQGYDTVAYWTMEDDVRGKPQFSTEWAGTVWFFSSAENREMFLRDPEKYAPEYGGHCALAAANGYSARGAGDAWSVYDGKLYLNYSKRVRENWLRGNTRKYVWQGDTYWPSIKKKLLAAGKSESSHPVADAASAPKPLLTSLVAPESVRAGELYAISFRYDAEQAPPVERVCFPAGGQPNCWTTFTIDPEGQAIRTESRIGAPGAYTLTGYVEYGEDGETQESNRVSTPITVE